MRRLQHLERPGILAAMMRPGSPAAPGQGRRTPRDFVVDTTVILLSAAVGALPLLAMPSEPAIGPIPPLWLMVSVGLVSCVSLWWRRRWPVELAVVLTLLSIVLPTVGGSSWLALFSLAVHRRPLVSGLVTVLAVLSAMVQFWLYPTEPDFYWVAVGLTGMMCVLATAWGIVVRTRRQLMVSLAERATRAEAEQELRFEQGRRRERERIAREMHDALGHRLSLLSVHAGALEFRPDLPAAELARTAGVIRSSARECLVDLREIVGVLRAGGLDGVGGRRPQPTVADLAELVAESRDAGATVELRVHGIDLNKVPATIARHGYRIVQEALTNARKHAPGQPVTVEVSDRDGLTLEIRNPLAAESAGFPGSGLGLAGLAERVSLAEGRLQHGATQEGEFRLRAWLPWPADDRAENYDGAHD